MELIREGMQLDQKNRFHIPLDLMKRAGIQPNSKVAVSYDTRRKCIIIRSQDQLEKEIEADGKIMTPQSMTPLERDLEMIQRGQLPPIRSGSMYGLKEYK